MITHQNLITKSWVVIFSLVTLSSCSDDSSSDSRLLVLEQQVAINSREETRDQFDPNKPISVLELKHILKSENEPEIIRAMNRVKQNQESRELLAFVMQLWANDKQGYPDIPWHVINSERVRIEVANVIVQASNNGLVNINREAIQNYAKQVIASSNQIARGIAVSTLGLIRNPEDLGLIHKIALEENPHTFWAAIIALSESCDPKANVMLDDIKGRVSSTESKNFLRESASALTSYKYGCANQ